MLSDKLIAKLEEVFVETVRSTGSIINIACQHLWSTLRTFKCIFHWIHSKWNFFTAQIKAFKLYLNTMESICICI